LISARRDRKNGEKLVYLDDHGFDQWRAYHIVCMMERSGSGLVVNIPTSARLSRESERTCGREYERAVWSCNTLLEPHWRPATDPGRPSMSCTARAGVHSPRARKGSNRFVYRSWWQIVFRMMWLARPDPIILELKTCGFANAEYGLISLLHDRVHAPVYAPNLRPPGRDDHGQLSCKRKRKCETRNGSMLSGPQGPRASRMLWPGCAAFGSAGADQVAFLGGPFPIIRLSWC
jgi:hypothetical protein